MVYKLFSRNFQVFSLSLLLFIWTISALMSSLLMAAEEVDNGQSWFLYGRLKKYPNKLYRNLNYIVHNLPRCQPLVLTSKMSQLWPLADLGLLTAEHGEDKV